MLNANENQDLSYVGLQLSEILFLVDQYGDYGTDFIIEQIRHCAQSAIDRFEQPQGIIIFELAE